MSHPDTAMVLAAGLGLRMRPITDTIPKPLVPVGGQPLIAYAFDRVRAAGVRRVIVNVHYLADPLEAWARAQNDLDVVISDERDAVLETGGGIARALPLLGNAPFFVLNSDSFWLETHGSALTRLAEAWDEARMDCLLLLCPMDQTVGYGGAGDFYRHGDGHLTRRTDVDTDAARDALPGNVLVYIGGCLIHPRLFLDSPQGKFSLNVLWNRAIAANRLHGIVHAGRWLHVGTPDAIAPAEKILTEAVPAA